MEELVIYLNSLKYTIRFTMMLEAQECPPFLHAETHRWITDHISVQKALKYRQILAAQTIQYMQRERW